MGVVCARPEGLMSPSRAWPSASRRQHTEVHTKRQQTRRKHERHEWESTKGPQSRLGPQGPEWKGVCALWAGPSSRGSMFSRGANGALAHTSPWLVLWAARTQARAQALTLENLRALTSTSAAWRHGAGLRSPQHVSNKDRNRKLKWRHQWPHSKQERPSWAQHGEGQWARHRDGQRAQHGEGQRA